MESYHDKRIRIRLELANYFLTYQWLINELQKRGVNATMSEVSDSFTGRRQTEKYVSIVELSEDILRKYKTQFADI